MAEAQRQNAVERQGIAAQADAFRAAMRRLASTVTIITASSDGQWYGMAATAVTSLTTSPPSLLVCINTSASIHDPIAVSGRFCVNLLACDHNHLVPIFSGRIKGEERFASGEWMIGESGIPCLAKAQANIFCTVARTMVYGSHSVFVGKAGNVVLFGDTSPLLYQEGAFFKSIALDMHATTHADLQQR